MNSLKSALKSQDNDYAKNPLLFFNICQKVRKGTLMQIWKFHYMLGFI